MLATLPRNSTNVRQMMAFAWHRLRLQVASTLTPRIAVRQAAQLFATPPRIGHTAKELAFLAQGEAFAVEAGDTSLAAWRFGAREAPVVLLSHGWGGRGAQLRSFVDPLLEAGYQVVLWDHAGHGKSAGATSTLVHFIRGLDAIARHLEARGGRLAGIVGHSLGAAAAGAWLNETRRPLRAVLIAPPTSLVRYSTFFARRLGLPEALRRQMQQSFERALGKRWAEFELPASVAHVRAPALVVHDQHDREVPVGGGIALANAWHGARLVRTRGLGHRAILRDAEVARDVVDFIANRTTFPPPPAPGERRAWHAPAPIL